MGITYHGCMRRSCEGKLATKLLLWTRTATMPTLCTMRCTFGQVTSKMHAAFAALPDFPDILEVGALLAAVPAAAP